MLEEVLDELLGLIRDIREHRRLSSPLLHASGNLRSVNGGSGQPELLFQNDTTRLQKVTIQNRSATPNADLLILPTPTTQGVTLTGGLILTANAYEHFILRPGQQLFGYSASATPQAEVITYL